MGVDISGLRGHTAGVSRYVLNMLTEMMVAEPRLRFILYAASEFTFPLPPGNWRVRHGSGPLRRYPGFWVQRDLPGLLASDRVDIFWGQNHLVPVKLRRPCFRVATIHDVAVYVVPETMPLKSRISMRCLLASAARCSDLVIAVSRATERLVRTLLRVSPAKTRMIYEGCGGGLGFANREEAAEAVRQRLSLDPGYVLNVGTIEPRKDLPVLLHALRRLDKPPLLVVVGDLGWRHPGILRQIAREQRSGRVRYLGRVSDDDLRMLYGAAALSVYPSMYEGFGLPVLEAMAGGCPVLCSWSSSLPEVGGRAAEYFLPRSDADLAAKLQILLSDPAVLDRMRQDGLVRAGSFSFRRSAEQFLDVVEEAIRVWPRRGELP